MSPVVGERRSTAGPEVALCDTVLDSVREQVEALRELDPLVRAEAAEAVTEMRVATRRLRCILLGFHKVYAKSQVRPVADQLKWLGAELSDENDTEMLVERLTEVLTMVPADLVIGPVQEDLLAALKGASARYERSIHAALDGPRYAALWASLDRLVADPPLRRKAPRAGRRQLTASMARACRLVDRNLTAAIELPHGHDQDEAIHEARKAAKRVRYMAESVLPEAGKPARRLRRRAKKLQNELGVHQDSVVARPALRELGVGAHAHGHSAFTYGLLYAAATVRSHQVVDTVPEQRERLRVMWHKHWQSERGDSALPRPEASG